MPEGDPDPRSCISPDGETVDLVLGEVSDQSVAEVHVVTVHLLEGFLYERAHRASGNEPNVHGESVD